MSVKIEEKIVISSNKIKDCSDLIHQVIIDLFSRWSDMPWSQNIESEKKKNNFPSIHALFETLTSYKYRIFVLSKKEVLSFYEISWLTNAITEIINQINNYIQMYGVNILAEFKKNLLIEKYYEFIDGDYQEHINNFSEKRHQLGKKTKRHHDDLTDNDKFHNFIISLRNFSIHPNSKGYKYIMLDNFKDTENKIRLHNVNVDFFQLSVDIDLFLEYLKDFLSFTLENKEKILTKMNKTNVKYYKTPTREQIEEEIKNYLQHSTYVTNKVIKEAIGYYDIYYYIYASQSDPKYHDMVIDLIIIASLHFRSNTYSEKFEKFVGGFHEKYLKIVGPRNNGREGYAISQMEDFPDIFCDIAGSDIYNKIQKRNEFAELHQNIAAMCIDDKIASDPKFMQKIQKYMQNCMNGSLLF